MNAKRQTKKNNSAASKLRNIFFSLLVFIAVTIIVTDLLQSRIFFSFFVGFPTGFVAGVLVFALLTIKQRSKKS
ncbi:MAG: hypothetical protein PHD13_07220 [Methanocellales archaeon]|nr:hypothetical protein [Methanocellales archaeon]MDD3292285.1 hypothetical protein [Methanocellales archaeon]MDD5235947.1 hypothetical protein [Methanocellales archaeon]MDD5485829.1 hypothetical protein [Methanocellales archaeon]